MLLMLLLLLLLLQLVIPPLSWATRARERGMEVEMDDPVRPSSSVRVAVVRPDLTAQMDAVTCTHSPHSTEHRDSRLSLTYTRSPTARGSQSHNFVVAQRLVFEPGSTRICWPRSGDLGPR